MNGSKNVWGFRWACVQHYLLPDEVDLIQQRFIYLPHETDDINDAGTAWEYPLDPNTIDLILSRGRIKRLEAVMGVKEGTIHRLIPRFWNSVVRTQHDTIPWHTDMLSPDPARTYSLILYLNDYWDERWGGATLLRSEKLGVQLPIYPSPGSLLIFEVNKHSWHTVEAINTAAYRHVTVGWLDDPDIECDVHGSTRRAGMKMPSWVPGDTVFNRHLRR